MKAFCYYPKSSIFAEECDDKLQCISIHNQVGLGNISRTTQCAMMCNTEYCSYLKIPQYRLCNILLHFLELKQDIHNDIKPQTEVPTATCGVFVYECLI